MYYSMLHALIRKGIIYVNNINDVNTFTKNFIKFHV